MQRFYYAVSALHCRPEGIVGDDAARTGTVIRTDTVREYAAQAGFAGFEVTPVENDFWRSYL